VKKRRKLTFTIILMFILVSIFNCSKDIITPNFSYVNDDQKTMEDYIVVHGYSRYIYSGNPPCMATMYLYTWENDHWELRDYKNTHEDGYYEISMIGIPTIGAGMKLHAVPWATTDGPPQDRYWSFEWNHVEDFWWPNDNN